MTWHLQEAEQQFCNLVQQAIDEGPQVVSNDGEELVVVLSAETYRLMAERKPTFKEVLLSGPDFSMLDLTRDEDYGRDVDL